MSNSNIQDVMAKLQEEFSADDLEWRIGRSGENNGKVWAVILAYVTNRAIQKRLDDIFTPFGWKNDFKESPCGGLLCGISVKHEGEWITKWDGAENTDIEGVKGGLSGSMKRAAVQFGIGRYLYGFENVFAEISLEKRNGYNYAKTKKGKIFYWKAPNVGGKPSTNKAPKPHMPFSFNDVNSQFLKLNKQKQADFLSAFKVESIDKLLASQYEKALGDINRVLIASQQMQKAS